MATHTETRRRGGESPRKDRVARLQAEIARLRAQIRALKAGKGQPTKLKKGQSIRAEALPALPAPDTEGNYPAGETLDVIVARQLIRRRQAAGWTQAELARRAGVRQETVSRVESGKHAPTVSTVDKLDRVLRQAGV